jgi:hypothetical protein
MAEKHIDLIYRRIINEEVIPHSEKVFSIFEPYTEWITKGKSNPKFELGKIIQVTSNQNHLIIDAEVIHQETDSQSFLKIAERILKTNAPASWSVDRNYYNSVLKELLSERVPLLVMPKKGKKNEKEKAAEQEADFQKYHRKHSAIESNINALEHRGLDKCPDKGIEHFNTYVHLAVCAYNLHRIGAEMLKTEKQRAKEKAQFKNTKTAA